MSPMFLSLTRPTSVLLRSLAASLLLSGAPADAGVVMEWNFRDGAAPAWLAGGDVSALRSTQEGLVVEPSGPAPTLVSPSVDVSSDAAAYVKLSIRSPTPIEGAYVGWASVDPSGREANAGLTFTIPRGLHGGLFRTIWVPVADSPNWSGQIRRLGLALPVDERREPITIQAVELVAPGPWTLAQVAWVGMGGDIVSGWMASQGSMMSLGYLPRTESSFRYPAVPRATWTLHGYAGFAVVVGLALLGVARWTRVSKGSWMIAGAGVGVITIVIGLLAVLSTVVETSVWRTERTLFGNRPPVDADVTADGINLTAVVDEIRHVVPQGAAVAVCLSGERWHDEAWFWPVRYHLYPIPVEPEGLRTFPTGQAKYRDHFLLVFADTSATCASSQRTLAAQRRLYSLYRP